MSDFLNIRANTVITALFGALISILGVVNHLQTKASHDDTLAAVKEVQLDVVGNYVSKTEFTASVAALSQTDSKLWEKEAELSEVLNKNTAEINIKLQHIEDAIPSINK